MTTVTVNKPAIRILVNALRSGRFKQGRRHLVSHDVLTGELRYCCLGVACIMAAQAGVDVHLMVFPSDDPRSPVFRAGNGNEATNSLLPPEVADYYGVTIDPNIEFPENGAAYSVVPATNANDDLGYTFEEIADAFERTYLADGDADARQ